MPSVFTGMNRSNKAGDLPIADAYQNTFLKPPMSFLRWPVASAQPSSPTRLVARVRSPSLAEPA